MRPIRTPPNNVGAPAIFCSNTGLISTFLLCLDSRGFRGKTEQVPPGRPTPLSTRCCGHHTRRSLISVPYQKTLLLVTRALNVVLDPATVNTQRSGLRYVWVVTWRHPPSFPQQRCSYCPGTSCVTQRPDLRTRPVCGAVLLI